MDDKSTNGTNMHGQHRERVRQRFLSGGLDGFPSHNVLEFLLFYSVPRRDTNELAHRLIDTFGSLSAVFEAPFEELVKVDGIGENSATLILLMTHLFKRYSQDKQERDSITENMESLENYVKSLFIGITVEKVKLLCFDNTGKLTNCSEVSTGTKNSSGVDNRTLLECAFRNSATHVILAHNHPSGFATPSSNDVQFTKEAAELFGNVEIRLLDHFIVASDGCFSMAHSHKYSMIF